MSERRIPVAYVLAALSAVAVVLLAWIGRGTFEPIIVGARAPDFEYVDLDGEPVTLSQLRGKVVLVNVWATWCPPCREEMPSMQRLYDRLHPRGFEILAVSIDAPAGQLDPFGRPGGDLRGYMDENSLTFPVLRNPSGDIQRTYQTTGVPESFLIGPDGVIRRKVAGPTEWDHPAMESHVERLLESAQ